MAQGLQNWTNSSWSNSTDPYQFCHASNVSYHHRVNDREHFSYCVVPDSGEDVVLFAGVALLLACILQSKLSALWVLLAGVACEVLSSSINLGRWGNAISLFLTIHPAEVLFYILLPPLLLDDAVRIEFFIFKQVLVNALVFAFLLVVLSCVMLVPVLLWGLQLVNAGWQWQHGALFGAMVASTDAVAIAAILKKGGAPEKLMVLMEGESLFNDASGIVLFEVFFSMVKTLGTGAAVQTGLFKQAVSLITQIVWLAIGGFAIGLVAGIATRYLLRMLRWRGAKPFEEIAVTIAMAYLVFYIANAPAKVSGVIAVVVYGLYGAATAKWGMSAKLVETGEFDEFWNTVAFALNGITFFYAGVAAANFFIRTSEELYTESSNLIVLLTTFWRLPFIYAAIFAIRLVAMLILSPIFVFAGQRLTFREILFATWGGLRGAVSLIMAQTIVVGSVADDVEGKIIAQIAMWTAGTVVLTLMVNAPLMPRLLLWTGLRQESPVKRKVWAKAVRALQKYTAAAIQDLQHDEDEMLRGVDWDQVAQYTDHSKALAQLLKAEEAGTAPEEVKEEHVQE